MQQIPSRKGAFHDTASTTETSAHNFPDCDPKSKRPITIPRDLIQNRNHARPDGVPRNSLEGPGFANVDLRWFRDFVLAAANNRKRMVTIGVDAFNVLNRVNYNTPVGNLSSPFFGQSISSQPPRRIQFSLRLRY